MASPRNLLISIAKSDRNTITCDPLIFVESLLSQAAYFYSVSPWKIIPGPWVIRVANSSFEKFCVIGGATDKSKRALYIFSTYADYSADFTLFEGVIGFDNQTKTLSDFIVGRGGSRMTPSTLLFLEVAMKPIADFILEAVKLGGGVGSSDSRPNLSARQVLDMLSVRSGMNISLRGMNTIFTGGSSNYPCIQNAVTVTNSLSSSELQLHVVLTESAIIESERNVSRDSQVPHVRVGLPARIPMPLSEDSTQCMVCLTTESDIKSRPGGSKGLMTCACRSKTEKYCCVGCQKSDWKRHKVTCLIAIAKLKASS